MLQDLALNNNYIQSLHSLSLLDILLLLNISHIDIFTGLQKLVVLNVSHNSLIWLQNNLNRRNISVVDKSYYGPSAWSGQGPPVWS